MSIMFIIETLSHEENHEVFIQVIKVTCIVLIEVVEELSLCIVLSGNTAVTIANAHCITVIHDSKDTRSSYSGCGLSTSVDFNINVRGLSKGIILAGTLPIRNSLSSRKFDVFIVPSIAVKVGRSGR